MRPQNQNKRMRSRNRKGPSPLSRSYESNGPDVKIRGTAQHIADKYAQLSRDAQSSGDRIMAENYLQHAEHYYRIVASAQPQRDDHARDGRPDDGRVDDGRDDGDGRFGERSPRDGDSERGLNGHASRMNGGSGNGARHFAESEQPDIIPPEHYERGGVENVPEIPEDASAAKETGAKAEASGGGDDSDATGDAESQPTRTRRRRTPRGARSRSREGDAEAGQAAGSDSGATMSASAEGDTSPGEA